MLMFTAMYIKGTVHMGGKICSLYNTTLYENFLVHYDDIL